MGETVENESYGIQSSNEQYNTFNAIKLRLDVQEELARFRASISGETVEYFIDDSGKVIKHISEKKDFKKMINNEGVDSVMAFMEGLITPHNAQGNVNRDDYGVRLANISRSIARMLHINKRRWGMSTESICFLFPLISHKIAFFLTRAVDDGERKSMQVRIANTNSGYERQGDNRKTGMFK